MHETASAAPAAMEVLAVYTDSIATPDPPAASEESAAGCEPERPLAVVVRAYGTQRGGLAEHVEEAIEAALRAAGAGAPGAWAGALGADAWERDADARLSDQLFRARRIGHDGISVRLQAVRALLAPVGGLDAADAHVIAFYARAAAERPVVLEMEEADKTLPAFVVARPLDEILRGDAVAVAVAEAEAVAEAVAVAEAEAVAVAVAVAEPVDVDVEVEVEDQDQDDDDEPASEPEVRVPSISLARLIADPPEPEPEPFDPTRGRWPQYVAALEAARGPQTLASFERVFVQSYLPLADAVDRGLDERAAVEARDEFRRTFARAYGEALPTFALTGKRPRMVLDAFDVAARMARASGARTGQVLLVDGMRFDVATRVAERLAELCEGHARLADRVTLFSALPSSTPRQLETLARGVDSLRSPHDDRDFEPLRGRTAGTVRRVRIGSRDLYKLDLVETTLAAAGDGALDALDDVIEDTARAIAKHVRAQTARALLLVVGDHGFRFEGGAARHGGASPEEVIVSAHGWVLGDLH
jgi:hypothetical protein